MESEAPTQEEVLDTNPMDIEENLASKKDVSEDTHREEIGNEEDEGLRIPLARVKRIIKQDPDVKLIATDSCFLISKATVCFDILRFQSTATYLHQGALSRVYC